MELKMVLRLLSALIIFHYASTEITSIPEDRSTQSEHHEPSQHALDDGSYDLKTNEKLMKNLQQLPTDKLKSILNLINKDDVGQDGNENYSENNGENSEAKNGDKSEDGLGNQDSGQNERKLSFHKLSHKGSALKDAQIDNGNGGSNDGNAKHEQNAEQNDISESDAGGKRLKNLDEVLFHAFEDRGENNDASDHEDSVSRRVAPKDDSSARLGHVRSTDDVTDKDETREDVFADVEDKQMTSEASNNETATNRMKLLHISTASDNNAADDDHGKNAGDRERRKNAGADELKINAEKHLETNTDKPNMERNGDETKFVDPVTLKQIKERHNSRYRKIIKEKLPTRIIEEINNAMVKNVQESGDKITSKQDGSQRSETKKLELLSDGGKIMLSHNDAELDATKRGRTQYTFSYDPESPIGPEMWKVLHTDWTCQGRKQSPINIRTDNVRNDTVIKNIVIHVEPEGRPISGILRNNGHAPTFSLDNKAAVRLIGGTLPNAYFLKQLHFHFGCENSRGSEHQIDGQKYPLELHLVFWDKNTFETFATAAKSDRGIAVVAVLFQRSFVPPPEMKKTPLAQLYQVLRKIPNEGDLVQITDLFDFRLERLIPSLMSTQEAPKFYTYEGSLSTPGCYETVTWIVFDSHPVITDDQLEMFRKLKSMKVNQEKTMCDNFRPIQKTYGRRIYSNII